MIWHKRNLVHFGIIDRFFFSVRLYTGGNGSLKYWLNWLPSYRPLGGRRFAIDWFCLGFIFEDYGL